ncbi:cingulin-like isoform X12 [Fagus crenata]
MIEAEKSRKKRKKKNNPLHTSSQPVDAPKVEQSDKVQAVPTAEELETKSVEGQDCFVRKERDPSTNDFLVRHQDPSSNICLRCGGSGHNMFSCRSEYSPDDLKDMGPRQVSCYSCGQSGHLGSGSSIKECTKAYGETSGSKSPALCYRCGEEGSSLPSTSEERVYIPEVIERDDSSNTSDIPDHDDISIQEVPLSMAPLATADIPESAAHSQENDLNMLPQIDTVVSEDSASMLPSNSDLAGAAMDKETNSGGPHIDQATTIQPWDIISSSIPSQANVFTTAIVEKVTNNTRSSKVDLVIQRCGETPHGISSPLAVGVVALGNTHPYHLNFGSTHSLAVNIVERDTTVSIVEKNDFDLIQEDFGSFLSRLNETRANLRIASHFWSFSEAKKNFFHFSVPAEAAPLLEKLLLKHGNFMDEFKLGTSFGEFSLALLAAVLMDIHRFLLDHIRNLGEMWFAQKERRKQLAFLSSKIAKMEEELLALKSEWEQLRRAAVPAMPLSNGLF